MISRLPVVLLGTLSLVLVLESALEGVEVLLSIWGLFL
jgi:hypothetical protein